MTGAILSASGALPGREDELAAIEAALTARSGRALLFEAPYGAGKSALLATAARDALDRGARVLGARATESARDHAFGVALSLTDRGAGAGKASLFDGAPPDALDRPRTTALIRTLATALARLAEQRPLMLVLDDAHHADEPSLELLTHIAAVPSPRNRITILTAAQSAAAGRPAALDALARAAGGARRLAPLGDEPAEEIVERVLPPGPPIARIVTACAGNPFLIVELTGAVARGDSSSVGEPVPPKVLARVRAELQLAGAEPTELARAIAAVQQPAPLGLVARLAGLDNNAADAAADALADRGIVAGGPTLAICEPLASRAVAADTPARTAARLHSRAAELLHDGNAPVDQVAGHLLLADRLGREWATDALVRASQRAREAGDSERAVEFGRRALEEPPTAAQRPGVVLDLGLSEADAGLPEAIPRLREAIELADDPEDRARCALRLGQALMIAGDRDGAEQLLARAIGEGGDIRSGLVEELRAAHAVVKVNKLDVDAHERVAALERLSPGYAGPIERSGLAVEAMTGSYLLTLDHERANALIRRALAGGALLSEESAGGVTLRFVTGALIMTDALDLGLEVTEAIVASELRRGSALGVRNGVYSRSWQQYFLGRIDDSLASAREALDEPPEDWAYLPPARAALGLALLELDDPEAAAAAVDVEPRPVWRSSILWPILVAAQIRVAIAQGRTDDALAGVAVLHDVEALTGSRNPATLDQGALKTLALLQAGDIDTARTVAEDNFERARIWGAPRALGVALRSLGLVTLETDHDAAIALLAESRDVLERSPSMLERTRTMIDLGIALRRADRRRDAREPLAQALDIADRFNLRALARTARDELKVVGARPRRTALSGVGALTPAEHRTATLAAEGMTNKQIAETLFVTVKAVEKHLGAVYGKLEIGSRREIAARLADDEDETASPPDIGRS